MRFSINPVLPFALGAAIPFASPSPAALPAQPDVLFIAIDDLSDWTKLHDPAAPIKMPNLMRLAQRGVFFPHAYAASPACNPSRTAVLTGLAPAATGVYGNSTDWRRTLPNAVTLPAYFKAQGYRSIGAGKIFHHHFGSAFHDHASFDEFLLLASDVFPKERLCGLTAINRNFDWGSWPPKENDLPDVKTADWAVAWLARAPETAPFFLSVGIFRPHSPHFAPARHFDAYPANQLRLPPIMADDDDDLPSGARAFLERDIWVKNFAADPARPGSRVAATRAYQACASFADEQIGRVLDALDRHPRGKSTIIVVWSDNGFQLGEKGKWEKFSLWEKATRVPLIIVVPGLTPAGRICPRPVSLLDLYPTLVDLCHLPAKPELHGESLVPLLRDPLTPRTRPAVMTYECGNHAVRSERWRYIRYNDGSEELYDHSTDPNEWTNLATRPELAAVKAELARSLPPYDAPAGPDLKP